MANRKRELLYEYNHLQMELEEMQEKAPYDGYRDKDGYMDYLEESLSEIKKELQTF